MKKILALLLVLCCAAALGACNAPALDTLSPTTLATPEALPTAIPDCPSTAGAVPEGAVNILLSDTGITVDGNAVSTDPSSAVYTAHDIVFYLAGQGFTYGEGTAADEHTQEEADAHTVVHITKPGTYALTGKLSKGQIAVDLGEDAEEDPSAVVTLYLNGADITCGVAPAVIFYNVYECGDADNPTKDVDTAAAGASVVIADGTENRVIGSYVARIYKSYTLNAAGTEVVDSKKLHKYDAAFYSKMSMNVNGGEEGTGKLFIDAENEGLDSELHLTVNGGHIVIESGNDGINTNEDGVSVTTVNGGLLQITVTGETGEGDGIDSNGWLVINGGTVIASACATSGDAGIDSDMGIHINGGTVAASGSMLDRIEEGGQTFAVFTFNGRQPGGSTYALKNKEGGTVLLCTPANDFSILILSGEALTAGEYTLWQGDTQYAVSAGSFGGGFGGGMMRPDGMQQPDGMQLPEGVTPGQMPEGQQPPITPGEGMQLPENVTPGQLPEGGGPFDPGKEDGGFGGGMMRPEGENGAAAGEQSSVFTLSAGGSYFSNVAPAAAE